MSPWRLAMAFSQAHATRRRRRASAFSLSSLLFLQSSRSFLPRTSFFFVDRTKSRTLVSITRTGIKSSTVAGPFPFTPLGVTLSLHAHRSVEIDARRQTCPCDEEARCRVRGRGRCSCTIAWLECIAPPAGRAEALSAMALRLDSSLLRHGALRAPGGSCCFLGGSCMVYGSFPRPARGGETTVMEETCP